MTDDVKNKLKEDQNSLRNIINMMMMMVVMMMDCFVVRWTDEKRSDLFPVGAIVRDPHLHQSLTHHEQGLNLHRTWCKKARIW